MGFQEKSFRWQLDGTRWPWDLGRRQAGRWHAQQRGPACPVSCDVLGSGRIYDLHCRAVTVVLSETASSWAGLEGTEREVARCAVLAFSLQGRYQLARRPVGKGSSVLGVGHPCTPLQFSPPLASRGLYLLAWRSLSPQQRLLSGVLWAPSPWWPVSSLTREGHMPLGRKGRLCSGRHATGYLFLPSALVTPCTRLHLPFPSPCVDTSAASVPWSHGRVEGWTSGQSGLSPRGQRAGHRHQQVPFENPFLPMLVRRGRSVRCARKNETSRGCRAPHRPLGSTRGRAASEAGSACLQGPQPAASAGPRSPWGEVGCGGAWADAVLTSCLHVCFSCRPLAVPGREQPALSHADWLS